MANLLAQTAQPTQPGQQSQQFTQSLMNSIAAGVPNTSAQDQQVQDLTANYAGQQAQLGTLQGRQSFLDNTQIAPMQNNYDQLASQLASYDQAVLKPQFAGTNPGLPSEMSRLSGYYNPNLSYESNSNLTPDQSIYNANPTYALTAQANQGSNIASLLDTINRSIGGQYKMGTANYAGALGNVNNTLDTLSKIMGLSNNLKVEQMRAVSSASSKDSDGYNNLLALSDKLVNDLSTGKVQWGDAWQQVKDFADRNHVSITPHQIDTYLHGAYDPSDPTGAKGLTYGWATPGAAQGYASSAGLRYKPSTAELAKSSDATNAIKSLASVYKSFQDTGTQLGDWHLGTQPANVVNYNNQKRLFADSLAKTLGLQRNGAQVNAVLNLLPNGYVNYGSDQAFRAVLQQMLDKNGFALVRDGQGNVGVENPTNLRPDETQIDLSSVKLGDIFK